MAGGDSLKISVDAHGNAVDELKRVQGAMKKNEKALRGLTGAGEASERQTRQNVRAQKSLKDSFKGARLAVGALAAAMAAKAFSDFVVSGEKAANIATRFAQAVPDAEQAIIGLKAATAGLVEETDLQVVANRFARLGVSVQDTRRLLELATKAAIDQGRGVLDVAKVIESSLKGRTTGLVEIGVNLDKITGLTAAYAKETGVAVGELDEMDRRLKVALPAALAALGQQFDGVNLSEFKLDMQQTNTAFADFLSDAQSFVATGWGDALRALSPTQAEEFKRLGNEIENTTQIIRKHNDRIGDSNTIAGWLRNSQSKLQDTAKDYAKALLALPIAKQTDQMAALTRQFGQQSPHVVALIRRYSGLSATAKQATVSVEALNDAVASDGGKAWVKWLAQVDKITGAQADKSKKRSAAAHAAARKARLSAQAGAEDQLSADNRELLHLSAMAREGTELGKLDEARRYLIEQHAAKMAKLTAKGVDDETTRALRIAAAEKHGIKLLELAQARSAAHDAEAKRAAAAHVVQTAGLQVARIEAKLAAAIEPIERARLEVQRARVQQSLALRTLSDDETEAAIQRVQVQTQLNSAMAVYNDEIAKASGADLASGLQNVADVMGNVSQAAAGMGEVGEALSIVSGAAGDGASIWAQYADSQIGVGTAIDGLIGVLGNAAGAFIADQQAKAAVASAFEAAASIAAFARLDIYGGIAHAAAATAFAVVASGAGGGASASAGGGGGGAPASAGGTDEAEQRGGFGDGGGRQVIVQFGSGIILGSAAAVGQAVQQAQYANRGTGQAAGY